MTRDELIAESNGSFTVEANGVRDHYSNQYKAEQVARRISLQTGVSVRVINNDTNEVVYEV